MDEDRRFTGGYSESLVRAFRMRMQLIRDAENVLSFYALKSLHFEKLKGNRSHQHSMRLNKQFRLILELATDTAGQLVVVVAIEDYH
jgi:proteic killer suppression protein